VRARHPPRVFAAKGSDDGRHSGQATGCRPGVRSRSTKKESGRPRLRSQRPRSRSARRAFLKDFCREPDHEGNIAAPCSRARPERFVSTDFRSQLLASGLLVRWRRRPVRVRSGTFEKVVAGSTISSPAAGADQRAPFSTSQLSFREPVLERSGYPRLVSRPAGLGQRFFEGGDDMHVELLERLAGGKELDGAAHAVRRGAVLRGMPTPVYPLCSGRLPAGGRRLRGLRAMLPSRKPSLDPARMQAFRFARISCTWVTPTGAVAPRDLWLERSR